MKLDTYFTPYTNMYHRLKILIRNFHNAKFGNNLLSTTMRAEIKTKINWTRKKIKSFCELKDIIDREKEPTARTETASSKLYNVIGRTYIKY